MLTTTNLVLNTTGAKRTAALLVLGAAVLASGLPAVAHAGFRPGLIAYDEYGTQNSIAISGRPVIATEGGRAWPTWSPNGDTLAFSNGFTVKLADRRGRVFAKTFQAPPLSSPAGAAEGAVDWSPDGRRIAFICAPANGVTFASGGTPSNLCVVDVTTGAHRVLATSTSQFRLPYIYEDSISWSPRGDVIAVDIAACPPGTPLDKQPPDGACSPGLEIGLVDVATGAITPLAQGASDPDFSPDGSEIAYVGAGTNGNPRGVDIMSAAGTFIRQVVPPEHAQGGFRVGPEWSPDGKKLLFSTKTDGAVNGNTDLFSVGVHGGRLTQMTHDPNDDLDASWAPLVTTCTVPKLKGQTLAKAKTLIKLAGCVLGKVTGPKKNRNKRHVVNQKPGANHDVAAGTKVSVQIR